MDKLVIKKVNNKNIKENSIDIINRARPNRVAFIAEPDKKN